MFTHINLWIWIQEYWNGCIPKIYLCEYISSSLGYPMLNLKETYVSKGRMDKQDVVYPCGIVFSKVKSNRGYSIIYNRMDASWKCQTPKFSVIGANTTWLQCCAVHHEGCEERLLWWNCRLSPLSLNLVGIWPDGYFWLYRDVSCLNYECRLN